MLHVQFVLIISLRVAEHTVLAVCEYRLFANHGKRKVAAHKLKLSK